MKKAFKVTFGALLAVSMAAPIAAVAHDPIANHVAVWGDLTYMRPSNNGLSVGDYALVPYSTLADGAHNHYFLEPENEFDFALGVSYRLPHSHNRVFFSYDHFSNDIDRQGDVNIRNIGISPSVTVGPNIELQPTQGVTEYDVKSHEYRLGLVHDLHLGDRFCLDLLAFLEYDRLKQNFNESISRNNNDNFRTRETENKVTGFGPGVGFMSHWYARNPHWQLFAGANTTLLKVENEFTQIFRIINSTNAAQVGQGYDYQPEDSDSIVGKLDIEFGINYNCSFRHELHGMKWDVALGMKYMNMFNVFKNGNTAFQVNGGGSTIPQFTAAPYLGAAQDWGKYGPFLRFKLGGNHS